MTSKLSPLEWETLEHGFRFRADHIKSKAAEEVLKKFGYEKVSARPPAKRKPGPKPKHTANPTEDEIRIRIEFLRLVLGDAAKKLSEAHLLAAIAKLLKIFVDRCSEGIYFTQIERARIQLLEKQSVNVGPEISDFLRPEDESGYTIRNLPTETELESMVFRFAKIARYSTQTAWAGMVKQAIDGYESKTEDNSIYATIRVHLGLAIEGPSVAEIEAQIAKLKKKRPRTLDARADKYLELKSLGVEKWRRELHRERSKNDTLRMAISKLFRIRDILDNCQFVMVDWETKSLYEFLHRNAYEGNFSVSPPTLGELEDLFNAATSRQGHSPFVPLFNEEMDPGPAWLPEDGQLKAKPPGEERIDPADAVVRLVKAAGVAGIVKGDIAKELVKRSICSQATAYNWIFSAEKQKRIQKLENTKRYVVSS